MISSGFSGVLKLTDLDDFITPSQVTRNQFFLNNKIVFQYQCFIGVYKTCEIRKIIWHRS